MSTLKGKVAFVTGGSRGIGRAISLALAEAGADVAINYASNHDRAEETCRMIRDKGVKAEKYAANIAHDAENHEMISKILANFGKIDILVNNAGITRDKTFTKMTGEIWNEVLSVNLTGQAMVTHEVLKTMTGLGWGRIIFITSIVGQTGNFGQSNYAVAKGGLIAGKAIELTYDAGVATANMGAYGLLGKEAPPFVMAPALEVTKDNLAEAYQQAWKMDPPEAVMEALGQ